jgi:hypothetical protein
VIRKRTGGGQNGKLAKRKLEILAMGELELRSLASKALDGQPDNEDLLNPEPGTDMQLSLAELGRRWQRWYLFKMLMRRPAPTLRTTADDAARSQREVGGADATGADATGVLAAIHYIDHYVGRKARRQWRGHIKHPLTAHLQTHGLAHTASQVPLARFFGLEPRDAEQEETYEVQPEVEDMVWLDLDETPREREWHLARAREWVTEASALRSANAAEPRAPSAEKRSRAPDDSTDAAKRPRLSNRPRAEPWSNDKPVFTVTDVCLSSTGAVSAVSSPSSGLPTYAAEAGEAGEAGRPTYDPKYGPITYLTPEQIEQCVGSLMAKYGPPAPTPAAPPTPQLGARSTDPMNSMESAASAVVALMVGERRHGTITRAAHRRRENEQRAQKRQRARDQRREKTDPYYRCYSAATDLPVDEKPFTELEGLYVSASTEHSEQASEQAATREERFVSIVHALCLVAAQHGMPGLSVHDVYLTKAPATLRITLGRLIEVSVPQHLRDHARLAIPRVLCASCGFGPRSARQLLETPLRELCGMTTKIPHFNFIRRGARHDAMSTADVLRKFTANSPQLTRDIVAAAAAATGP